MKEFVEHCEAEIAKLKTYLGRLRGAGGTMTLGRREAGVVEYTDYTAEEVAKVRSEIAGLEVVVEQYRPRRAGSQSVAAFSRD